MRDLCEYSMTCLVAQHPWAAAIVAVMVVVVLLLPRRIRVMTAGRRRVVYESAFVQYVRRADGWDLHFPIIARVQQELQGIIGWLWQQASGIVRGRLWVLLRDWLARWLM
jgi:hypothetical protein